MYHSNYSVNPHEYEHPEDRAALEAIQKLGPLAGLMKLYMEKWVVPYTYGRIASMGIRVSSKQFPQIYGMVVEAARILNLNRLPRIYIQPGQPNAFAMGTSEDPFICLMSGAVDIWTPKELLAVIGHECGHIKSNHLVYHGLGRMLYQMVIGTASSALGGQLLSGQVGILALPLLRWSRKAELTSDRAGLIVSGDLEAARMVDVKMVLGSLKLFDQVNVDEFLSQREEFEGFTVENLAATLYELQTTHPVSLSRVKALDEYARSESYHRMRSKIDDMKKGLCPLTPINKTLQPTSQTQCPKCCAPLIPGERFCGKCGTDTQSVKQCVRCGRTVEPGLQFCPACGTKLEGVLRQRV
jgi:Zn-dependent protease with chaperone function